MKLESIGQTFTNRDSLVGIAVVVGGAVLGYKVLKSDIDKKLREKVEQEAANNPAVAQATRLRGALYPGVHFSTILNPTKWGYDSAALMRVATEITDWKAVEEFYSKLYNVTAGTDVRKIATAEDYAKFIAIVSAKEKGNPNNAAVRAQPAATRTNTTVKPTRNNIVIAKKTTRIRKTARKVPGVDWLFSTDFPVGSFLGFTTGETAYNGDENIYYMQIWWFEGKDKKITYGWVTTSSEFVEVFSSWNSAAVKFPKIKHAERRTDKAGKVPAVNIPLSGIGFIPRRLLQQKMAAMAEMRQMLQTKRPSLFNPNKRFRS